MADLVLKDAAPGKWGHIVVYNKDGSFNREFKITADELVAVMTQDGVPPGVSKDEWHGGLAVCSGKDFEIGDVADQHGYLLIKYSERLINDRIVESFAQFKPGEWSGDAKTATASASVIDAIDGKPFVALSGGTLSVK